MCPISIKVINGYFRLCWMGTKTIATTREGQPLDFGGYFLREEAQKRKVEVEGVKRK